MTVVLIDYGTGNLMSIKRALHQCHADYSVSHDPHTILNSSHLIIPGVGAFGRCMQQLRSLGLTATLNEAARIGKSMLGICVGMQVLFEKSEEFGHHEGLGILPGEVKRLSDPNQKRPHMGWASLTPVRSFENTPLQDITAHDYVYFVHSYTCQTPTSLAITTYGQQTVCAACQHGNIYGTQFHPEKSGIVGLQLLQRFLSYGA